MSVLPPAPGSVLPGVARRVQRLGVLDLPAWAGPPATVAIRTVGGLPLLRQVVSRFAINFFGYATGPRPRALTLGEDYPTWRTLTDRRWTGRHLPPAAPEVVDRWPDVADVVGLFRRDAEMVPATDTSAMFAFFAQWFTDSFLRTDHRNPLKNTSNHEIDLCQIYGLNETDTGLLRAHTGGRLASQDIDGAEYPPFLLERTEDGDWRVRNRFKDLHDQAFLFDRLLATASPEHKDTFFAVGLPHGNSTVGQTMMNTVFLREHNRVAGLLAAQYSGWDDERLFQTTRNILIALVLKLVVEEYIRHIAPFDVPLQVVPSVAETERWNRPNWCAVEFDLLYRWHPLVPDTVHVGGVTRNAGELVNANPLVLAQGPEALMADCSRARAGRIGLANTPWFLVDRAPGADLHSEEDRSPEEKAVALARTARLRSFNEYREAFGLRPLRSIEELTGDDRELARRLSKLYDSIDDVEWYVGIFAEAYADHWMMGELMTTMVAHDAFTQALTNPLLAHQVFGPATFSARGTTIIGETTCLADIVRRNASDPGAVLVSFAVPSS